MGIAKFPGNVFIFIFGNYFWKLFYLFIFIAFLLKGKVFIIFY